MQKRGCAPRAVGSPRQAKKWTAREGCAKTPQAAGPVRPQRTRTPNALGFVKGQPYLPPPPPPPTSPLLRGYVTSARRPQQEGQAQEQDDESDLDEPPMFSPEERAADPPPRGTPPPPPNAPQTGSHTVVGGRRLHPSLQEAMLFTGLHRPVLRMALAGDLPLTPGDTHA